MQQNLAQVLMTMGRDVAIPGVELAINLLQELLADLKKGGGATARDYIEAELVKPVKRLGRPPKNGSRGWDSMNAEERSAEMKRRMTVRKANKEERPYVNHPRDPRHPGHEQWIKRLKASQKKAWNAKTPAERQAHSDRMRAARAAKAAA